jgi:ABC-type uncharacterized transport system auxiliary subunit
MKAKPFCFVVLIVLSVIAGCVSVERSYPDKRFFLLSAAGEGTAANPGFNGVLLFANLRVSPRYEAKSFVYRRTEANYESDFYNQFLVSPAAVLSEEVRRGLARAQVFQYVVGASSQLEPTHVLEGTVDALYGDFRDPSAPKAVLEMEFFLSKESTTKAEIVAHTRYAKSVNVSGRSPEALVRGWNDALNDILTSLVTDLKAAKL